MKYKIGDQQMNTVAKWMVAVAATSAMGSAASAGDTFETFAASGTFRSGNTLGGTLYVDVTTGTIETAALVVSGPNTLDDGVFSFGSTLGTTGIGIQSSFTDSPAGMILVFSPSALTSVGGGGILGNLAAEPYIDGVTLPFNDPFLGGSLSAVAVPEIDPASTASGLALLVGGLVVLRGRRPQHLTA